MSAARGSSPALHDGAVGQREVLDQAREVGWAIDWNARAQRTFGWSADEAVGSTLAELIIPPRYRAAHAQLLSPVTPIQAADRVLGRVRAATPRSQTRCAGVALFNGCESAHALIARADAALYEAKALGRGRTVTAGSDQARRADGCSEEGRGS